MGKYKLLERIKEDYIKSKMSKKELIVLIIGYGVYGIAQVYVFIHIGIPLIRWILFGQV